MSTLKWHKCFGYFNKEAEPEVSHSDSEIVYVTPEPYLNRKEEINISNEPKLVLKVSVERSVEIEFFFPPQT